MPTVQVNGVARLIDLTTRWGSVVRVITPLGTISLYDSDDIRFDNTTANVFEQMGLLVSQGPVDASSGGRRLLASSGSSGASADGACWGHTRAFIIS